MASVELPKTADIIVIGAGAMGAGVAFELTRADAGKILLIDARRPVRGVTALTFGQVRTHYSTLALVKLAKRGVEILKHWDEEVGFGGCGYTRLGYFIAAHGDTVDPCRRNVELSRQAGIDTRFIGPDELHELEPLINLDGIEGAAYEPDGGWLNGTQMVLSWMIGAQQLGAHVVTGVSVDRIRTAAGKVTGIETPAGSVDCPLVVNCAGAWGRELAVAIGIETPITFKRLDMAWMRQAPDRPTIKTAITDTTANMVLRPDMGGLFLAVCYPAEQEVVEDEELFPTQADVDTHLARLRPALAHRVPDLAGAQFVRPVAGPYDMTSDAHPIVGRVASLPGYYSVLGWSGHGIKLAPAVGEAVCADILGHTHDFDLHSLRPERFAEGDLNVTSYGSSARA
jgi:glycine/D-amino acid oxidase-like deaminating enzyme